MERVVTATRLPIRFRLQATIHVIPICICRLTALPMTRKRKAMAQQSMAKTPITAKYPTMTTMTKVLHLQPLRSPAKFIGHWSTCAMATSARPAAQLYQEHQTLNASRPYQWTLTATFQIIFATLTTPSSKWMMSPGLNSTRPSRSPVNPSRRTSK